jgi:hypothetical protein
MSLLEKALEKVVALPQDEQDAIASQILASLSESGRVEALALGDGFSTRAAD